MVKLSRCFSRKFIDQVLVYARGGTGGQGSLRLGGIGGEGGDVEVLAVKGNSLTHLARLKSRRFLGSPGEDSSSGRVHGKKGKGVVIKVPPGTVVYNMDKKQLRDLAVEGSKQMLVRGGVGGSHMSEHYNGLAGERAVFRLALKSIADIGLVGFPNAGKSTLLKVLTNATPKIANYPFTTLNPQLGTIPRKDGTYLTLADLPGLVEGAHSNVGMGHKFLQHVERTQALLYVVDVNGFQLSSRHAPRNAYDSLQLLVEELELYCPGLAHQRKAVLVLNKMDSILATEKSKTFLEQLVQWSPVDLSCVIQCSAMTTRGTQELKTLLLDLLSPPVDH